MFALAGVLVAAVLVGAMDRPHRSGVAAAGSDCTASRILGLASSNQLVISQVFLRHFACTDDRTDLGDDDRLREKTPIYIFLRLEGQASFLDPARDGSAISVVIEDKNGLRESGVVAGMKSNIFDAETIGAQHLPSHEYFDWTVFGRVEDGLKAGKYYLRVELDKDRVCIAQSLSGCDSSFEVR